MAANGVGSIKGLEAYFEKRVLALAKAAGRSYIVWQVRARLAGQAAGSITLHALILCCQMACMPAHACDGDHYRPRSQLPVNRGVSWVQGNMEGNGACCMGMQ